MNTNFRCGLVRLTGVGLLMLSACVALEAPPPESSPPPIAAPVEPPPAPAVPKPVEKSQVVLPAPRPARPAPAAPLDVVTDCSFRSETGYNGQATLEVRKGTVRRMRTVVNLPQQGQCVFELADMRQTKIIPSIELHGRQTACTIRISEQGRQVAMSFLACATRCTPREAFAEVRPVLIDKSSGKCE